VRRPDRNRVQSGSRSIHAQNRQVLVGIRADRVRFPIGMIGHGHGRGIRVLNHVEIRDDVTVRIPDKPRTGSLRNLEHVETERILPDRQGGDVDHGRRGLTKERDHRLLVLRQIASRHDRTRLGRRPPPGRPQNPQRDDGQEETDQYAPLGTRRRRPA